MRTVRLNRTLWAVCEGCPARRPLSSGYSADALVAKPEQVRTLAEKVGWRVVEGRTLCPECAGTTIKPRPRRGSKIK